MKLWFVILTLPGQEYRAAKELRSRSFGVYVAKTYRRARVGHKVKPIASLRFPSYVFVAFDAELEEHGHVVSARGVAHLLCDKGGTPQAIPESAVDLVRQCEDEEFDACTKRARRTRSDLEPGMPVRLHTQDLWRGRTGTLIACERGIGTVLIGTFILTVKDIEILPMDSAPRDGVAKLNRKIA